MRARRPPGPHSQPGTENQVKAPESASPPLKMPSCFCGSIRRPRTASGAPGAEGEPGAPAFAVERSRMGPAFPRFTASKLFHGAYIKTHTLRDRSSKEITSPGIDPERG